MRDDASSWAVWPPSAPVPLTVLCTVSLLAGATGWLPGWTGALAALGAAGAILYRPIIASMRAQGARVRDHRGDQLQQLAAVATDALVEGATHGRLAKALDDVIAAGRAAGTPHVEPVAVLLERVGESRDHQRRLHASGGIGPVPATAPAAPFGAIETMSLYSILESDEHGRRARLSAARAFVGLVLDEIRMLHTRQIEYSVLLVTLWTRALLLCGAPMLAGVSFAPPPLAGGASPADVPWALATAVAVVTALQAPAIAAGVMDRGPRGALLCRRLLVVEVPIALALCGSSPAWTCCLFVSGWTNWLQRPVFNWARLAAWIVAVATAQAVGLALAGVEVGRAALEIVATFAAVGITGGSYGAMLPVSASLLVQALRSGRATRFAAARAAYRDLLAAADELDRVARDLERVEAPDAARACTEARDIAVRLRRAAGRVQQDASVITAGLAGLLAGILRDCDVAAGNSQTAIDRLDQALAVGEPPPMTHAPVVWMPQRLAGARVTKGRHRDALVAALRLAIDEAQTHGEGLLSVRAAVIGGRLEIATANVPSRDRRRGPGSGKDKLAFAVAPLPSGDVRRQDGVDGRGWGRPGVTLFVTTVVCETTILKDSGT